MKTKSSECNSVNVPSDETSETKSLKRMAAENIRTWLVNSKLFAIHSKTLIEILETLRAENSRKKQLITAVKSGNVEGLKSSKESEVILPKYPCKFNDLRYFIDNISSLITECDLLDYFEAFGEIVDLHIDTELKKAFITFSFLHDGRPPKDHKVKEFPLVLEEVSEALEEDSSTTVAITGNIEELSGDILRKYLRTFGAGDITDFRRTVNRRTNKFSRFIFVKFDKPEQVEKLLETPVHHIRSRRAKFHFEVVRIF